ncbi:MFS transporter [Myxococcota bacterium]|nr:MFS transporter [Myxococcota bacterium]
MPTDLETTSTSGSRRHAHYFLFLIVLVTMFNTVDRHIISILLDDIKHDLALTDRQLGWILGPSFTIVYTLAVFPLARWSDRGVRRNIIALGLSFWSFFTFLTAWTQTFIQLFVMRMGVGLGEASASPAAQSLISDSVPPEQRSRGLSIMSIGGVLGLAVGMAGGGWINELWGWRTAFVAAGLPGLALALLFRMTVREPERGAQEKRDISREKSGNWWEDSRYLLSLPSMRWLILAHALALFYTMAKGAWEPTFIRRVYDMGSGAAGTWYFFTTPIPSMAGLFFGGWICDRWSQRDPRAHFWVPAISIIAACPFFLAFLLWPEDQRIALPGGLPPLPVAFVFSIIGSILGAMHSAPFLAAVQGLARLRMRASAAALFSLTGAGLGSGLGPLIAGDLNMRMEATYGDFAVRWTLAWLTLSFLLTALVCLVGTRSFRNDLARSQEAPPSP